MLDITFDFIVVCFPQLFALCSHDVQVLHTLYMLFIWRTDNQILTIQQSHSHYNSIRCFSVFCPHSGNPFMFQLRSWQMGWRGQTKTSYNVWVFLRDITQPQFSANISTGLSISLQIYFFSSCFKQSLFTKPLLWFLFHTVPLFLDFTTKVTNKSRTVLLSHLQNYLNNPTSCRNLHEADVSKIVLYQCWLLSASCSSYFDLQFTIDGNKKQKRNTGAWPLTVVDCGASKLQCQPPKISCINSVWTTCFLWKTCLYSVILIVWVGRLAHSASLCWRINMHSDLCV